MVSKFISEQKCDSELKKHGGQDWKNLINLVEDFSVTTNGLPPPECAIQAVKDCISLIDHYPAIDCQPALNDLSDFLWPMSSSVEDHHNPNEERLLIGNGASQIIDILMRVCKERNMRSFRGGPSPVQYMDYQRCAILNKLEILDKEDDSADVLAIVNPSNPTGFAFYIFSFFYLSSLSLL